MNRKDFMAGLLAAACCAMTATLMPDVGFAQMDSVKTAMTSLKTMTAKLGVAKIEGRDPVAGKDAPGLYFGTSKMNNAFDVVDAVAKESGGIATLFVKAGAEYVRIATNVKKGDGSRAIGTILDPKGPVIGGIGKGDAYYGDADILGKPYVTGYEPIKDASGDVIGIYFVGFKK